MDSSISRHCCLYEWDNSGYSDQRGAIPFDNTPPAAPAGFHALANYSLVTLKWKASTAAGLKSNRIYYGSSSGATVLYDSVMSPMDSVKMVGGLTYGAMHYFTLTAVDSNGNESAVTAEEGDHSGE